MDFDSRFGDFVRGCENAIRYIFTDKRLCAEALNAAGPSASWYYENGSHRTLPKNDRLAVLGDNVAESVLCRRWYVGGQNKAVWTLIRGEALGNDFLAETGRGHGLDFNVHKDAGTPRVSEKMMATAVEAVLGAVHLDGGDDALASVMDRLHIVDPFENLVFFVKAPVWPFCRAAKPSGAFEAISRSGVTSESRVTISLYGLHRLHIAILFSDMNRCGHWSSNAPEDLVHLQDGTLEPSRTGDLAGSQECFRTRKSCLTVPNVLAELKLQRCHQGGTD